MNQRVCRFVTDAMLKSGASRPTAAPVRERPFCRKPVPCHHHNTITPPATPPPLHAAQNSPLFLSSKHACLRPRSPSLEKMAANQAIRNGHVFHHGGTRFLFYRFDEPIGYNQGITTNWIRIELTKAGKPTIHSFPVDLSSVRKYIPGAH